jgi:CRP-like cAMP-binding protein
MNLPLEAKSVKHLATLSAAPAEQSRNKLLEMLPESVAKRLQAEMTQVTLPQGNVLYESDRPLQYVYFPINAIVSLVYLLDDGASTELAVVGNEGMVGVQAFMGGVSMPNRAVVHGSGSALRMCREVFVSEFERSGGRRDGALQTVLLRYAQALLTQLAQVAVCNGHHCVQRRLSRWLLMSVDRTENDVLRVTQESIANLLGVRREGVTGAAGKLQSAGLIHYSRGRITVLDRAGLEDEACECYRVIRNEYERLLFATPARHACTAEKVQHASSWFHRQQRLACVG